MEVLGKANLYHLIRAFEEDRLFKRHTWLSSPLDERKTLEEAGRREHRIEDV